MCHEKTIQLWPYLAHMSCMMQHVFLKSVELRRIVEYVSGTIITILTNNFVFRCAEWSLHNSLIHLCSDVLTRVVFIYFSENFLIFGCGTPRPQKFPILRKKKAKFE